MLKSLSIIFLIFVITEAAGNTSETEAEIRKSLLVDYDKTLPPILFATNRHFMYTSLNILRIRGLDEKKGELIIEGPIIAVWGDSRLEWESDKMKYIRIPSKDIWMPTLYVYNRIEPEELTVDPLPISAQGGILWWAPRYTLRTACNLNLRYYPFDTQVCEVLLSFASKEGDYVPSNMSSPPLYTRGFLFSRLMLENHQWIPQSLEVSGKKMNVDSGTDIDISVYTFVLQRSMPLIPLGILTPCLSCILLLLTTFWMQAGSSLRSGISVTSMLVSSSSLFTLGKILPASGVSTPIIVEYVSITLIFSAVASVQTMLTSILRRCEKWPPVSYNGVIQKIPGWCLFLLRIVPDGIMSQQLDQKFLFSELEDPESNNTSETVNRVINTTEDQQMQSIQSLWLKYIVLLDRIMFYLLGIIILLFIVSVIVTE